MDAKDEGYEYKAISMREVMKYCRDIRGAYTDERQKVIQCVIEYLPDAFSEKHKFLEKTNVPMAFIFIIMSGLIFVKSIPVIQAK